jgi:hypothetical protein
MLAMYFATLGISLVQRLLTRIGSLIEQEIIAMASPPPKTPAGLPDPMEMLTPKEFAKAHKVSLSWLAKARKRGDGPWFVQFGRSIRYFPLRKPE